MKPEKMKGVLTAVRRPRGGVSVSHNKNTADMEPVRMPSPERVILPMQQHIGAPCTPTVKVGDSVSVGQVIGDSDKFISAPIHASISGKVSAIGECTLPSGARVQSVTIESDGEMRLFDGVEPPKVNNREDFLRAVRASGLVGMGGAGFPTHAKLRVMPDKHIDTLVINAAECEPYITVDYRECIDNSWDIMSGIFTIKEILGIDNVVIAVEDNKPAAFEVLNRIAENSNDIGDHVKLMALKSLYPQGAEKMMVQSATGRRVPPGKLPADVGCIVMNVGSAAFVSRYLKSGKPFVSRSITVDGSAISEPKNIRLPIGTRITDVIDYCGGYKTDVYKLLMGGPMMGIALADDSLPILKQNNAILAFAKNSYHIKKHRACIRCGRCVQVCPMSLMPTLIERYARVKDAESLSRIGVNVCMECGSCAYACPSGRPLVQYMRLAKSVVREAGDQKK